MNATTRKECRQCGAPKPQAAFEPLPSGGLRGICRDCRAAQKAAQKRNARAAWKQTPAYRAHVERQQREREAKEARKAYAREQREAAQRAESAAVEAAEEARRRKREQRKRGVRKRPLTAERQREIAAEVDRLVSLLMGTHPTGRINDQTTWEVTTTALRKLWLQSGEKVCISCHRVVAPAAILPPGPGNSYPGKCNSCAEAESRLNSFRVTRRGSEGPPLIPIRDGTAITVAEFARRVRDRQMSRNC